MCDPIRHAKVLALTWDFLVLAARNFGLSSLLLMLQGLSALIMTSGGLLCRGQNWLPMHFLNVLVAVSPAQSSDAFGVRCRYNAGSFLQGGFSLTVGSEYFGPRQGNAFGFAQAAPELSPAGGRAGLLLKCKLYGA